MRDASRFSRRDGDEAFAELKAIAKAGVRIFFVEDGTEFQFGSFATNITGLVKAMNAEYRRQIATWTTAAMVIKAKQGYVTGGKVFGFTNLRIDGHVERRICEPEAQVIRRIFTLAADGMGYTSIAKQLNAERALTPIPNPGRPRGWSPSTVREVIHRRLYVGECSYMMSRRRGPDGATSWAPRPKTEWIRVDRPELRIVPDALWTTVHHRITSIRTALEQAQPGGRRFTGRTGKPPRRRDFASPYLLSGFTRCKECGGSVGVLDRRQYGCIAHHKRGNTVCSNATKWSMAALDLPVLDELRKRMTTDVIMAIIDGVFRDLAPASRARDLAAYRRELQTLDTEIANLTTAIAQGDALAPLLAALKTRQTRRDELPATITRAEAVVDVTRISRVAIERKVRAGLAASHARLSGTVTETRELLRQAFTAPVVVDADGTFTGEILCESFASDLGLSTFVVRPAGLEPATPGLEGRCSIH